MSIQKNDIMMDIVHQEKTILHEFDLNIKNPKIYYEL